jgi:hypothetical protein
MRLKVLLSAYACEPGKGSESGVGWNLARHLATRHEVWVLTRANNRAAIESELARNPLPSLHIVYHDLPPWTRFWKRGRRGVQVYYYLWQLTAIRLVRRLHREVGFDVVQHGTFVKCWAPSALAFLKEVPFVWGPVGGGESAPLALWPTLGLRGFVYEAARALARVGGLRLLPRGEAPPREVRVRLAPHLPPRTTYAVMRANHAGRYVALLVDGDGRAQAVAKVTTTPEGEEAFRREARAIAAWGRLLRPPLRAPRILADGDGVLLLKAVAFRPRRRPWLLPVAVARAVGALEREGVSHGDLAPWNLLEEEGGSVLVDWEASGPVPAPAWDLCHWVVQAHALLGRPGVDELFAGLDGRGPLGEAIRGYLEEARLRLDDLPRLFRDHVECTRGGLDTRTKDGARGLAAREALLRELGRIGGSMT